jgi:UDP-sulfoquinovose synthase
MYNARNSEITQRENVLGTLNLLWGIHRICPEAHLIKLGSMGDYGIPKCDIPEGTISKECICKCIKSISIDLKDEYYYKCCMSGLLFPRTPNSFYHLANVHNTYNIHFACRNWGLRSTDIMQGVLFGLNETAGDNDLFTRFDYDEYFGTAINRFCAQALIGHPLTVYGKGNQTRGFLPLKDSIQCLGIAIENPPSLGEYRTFNQFEDIYSINQLAKMVQASAQELGMPVDITPIPNPRKEAEEHYYNPAHQKLFDLGYIPTTDIQSEITKLLATLKPFSSRIKPNVIMPKTQW